MDTIVLFKYIVFQLRDWYTKERKLSISDFNNFNDFTILKLIKLHFFVVAINSEKDSLLLRSNQFVAMPFGPVETTIYDFYKKNVDFTEFVFENNRIIFTPNAPVPLVEDHVNKAVSDSIDILKNLEPRLILADAGSLVSLTHTWNSWSKYYNIALQKNKFSEPIPPEAIMKDLKIVNLNFV